MHIHFPKLSISDDINVFIKQTDLIHDYVT